MEKEARTKRYLRCTLSLNMGITHTCETCEHTYKSSKPFDRWCFKVKSLAIIDSISVDHLMTLDATLVLIYSEL